MFLIRALACARMGLFNSFARSVCLRLVLLSTSCFLSPLIHALDGFTGGVTPSRFELQSKSGEVIRRSLELYNLGNKPERFRVRTVDWHYSDRGQISYIDELSGDSCRPWVRLERHELNIVPNPSDPRNFRFEIHVPEDAPRGECRFALMIEGIDNEYVAELDGGSIAMPVTGRIAVIVYVGINGVKPDVSVEEIFVERKLERLLPVVKVHNAGDGHGRLDSDLRARMANGETISLNVASSPILPKQKRFLTLNPNDYSGKLVYPLEINGKIYSDNHTYSIATTVDGS